MKNRRVLFSRPPLRANSSWVRMRTSSHEAASSRGLIATAFAVLALLVAIHAVSAGLPVTVDIRGRHVFHFRIDHELPAFRIEYVGDSANAPVEIRCYRSGSTAPF